MKWFSFKKTVPLDVQQQDRMWQLWANGQAITPYQQLMTYQAEVNNGGHTQFFFNLENTNDVEPTIKELLRVLPETLSQNLQTAFCTYTQYKDTDEARMDEILTDCDRVFYENEEAINALLKEYAETLQP